MDNPQKTLPGIEFESLDDITIDLSSFANVDFASQSSGLTISAAAGSPFVFTGTASPTFTIGSNQGKMGVGSAWTTTSGGTGATLKFDDDLWINSSVKGGTLSLQGDNADIDINGVSLMETLRGIQDRLAILTPDPGMEQEWDELRELREAYDKKLLECREKSRMWKTLQSMPPPPKL